MAELEAYQELLFPRESPLGSSGPQGRKDPSINKLNQLQGATSTNKLPSSPSTTSTGQKKSTIKVS